MSDNNDNDSDVQELSPNGLNQQQDNPEANNAIANDDAIVSLGSTTQYTIVDVTNIKVLKKLWPKTKDLNVFQEDLVLQISPCQDKFIGTCTKCQHQITGLKKHFHSNWTRHHKKHDVKDGLIQATIAPTKYSINSPKQIKFSNDLASLIVMESLPLRLAGSPWLRRLVNNIDHLLTPPTRKTVVSWVKKEHVKVEQLLAEQLKSVKYVSTGLDLWSSRSMQSYLGIMVHFVKDWQLHCKVIGFERMYGKHTAVSILKTYEAVTEKFGITSDMTVRVLRDCGSNVVCAFPEDIAFLPFDVDEDDEHDKEITDGILWEPQDVCAWSSALEIGAHMVAMNDVEINGAKGDGMRCVLHVWNRIIVNGLEKALNEQADFYSAMRVVGRVVNASHKNTKCAEAVEAAFFAVTKEKKTLKSRNDTRWLSDYYMVTRYLELRECVNSSWWKDYCALSSSITVKDATITSAQLQSLKSYVKLLKLFATAFIHFQDQTQARTGDVLPFWELFIREYDEWTDLLADDLEAFCLHVKAQLVAQYPSDADYLLTIAAVLHPANRVEWFELAKHGKSKESTLTKIRQQIAQNNPVTAPVTNAYPPDSARGLLNSGMKKKPASPGFNVLDTYLSMPITSSDAADAFKFWHAQSEKPEWQPLVNLFLWTACVLPGTHDVEALFSISGHINSVKRGRMSSQTLKKLVIVKCNKKMDA